MTQKKTKLYSGSRKTARATAAFMQGSGKVKINNVPAELITPWIAKERIMTPLELAGDYREKVDIDVRVSGGGFMGQAEAAAIAISRGFVDFLRHKELRQRIADYDKHLLSGDARQAEPKKFGGPGARRKRQKSYR
ncbi:MAG: 30S ribosomal protein S9 [Thaumarchaeota archaeon]|nr:30S ribosomal protein S9 [Nitrososphaerota archaeon]